MLKEEIDKLKETGDDNLLEIARLKDQLIEERKKVSDIENGTESQFSKFKRLLKDALMNPDSPVPLKDRLKTLFKAFGVSITSILSAIIMIFTTIGISISNSLRGKGGGGGRGGGGGGGGGKPSIPDRVKEGLKKFAEWLKYLAGKSAAAIPGIIGSIVSFLLKTIGQVVGFAAEHIMIFLVLVVSSIIYGLVEGVKEIKKSRN